MTTPAGGAPSRLTAADIIKLKHYLIDNIARSLDGEALPLIWIEAPGGNYDYQNKYFTDETKYHCPAGIPIAKETEIRAMALKAFEVLGCEGWPSLGVVSPPASSAAGTVWVVATRWAVACLSFAARKLGSRATAAV